MPIPPTTAALGVSRPPLICRWWTCAHSQTSRLCSILTRFATTTDREAITGMVVDAAEHAPLRLTPPELASVPASFIRVDGTSVFRPRHSIVYSSEQLLAAEDRLLERADVRTAPTVNIEYVGEVTAQPVRGQRLTPEQARALATIATDTRQLDLLVGLAPSAAAA